MYTSILAKPQIMSSQKVENRICQNCKQNFVIEPEDFSFYDNIKVHPPTFCPECRTVRRLCWRNEMSLYRRKCDAPGHNETIISIYRPESKLVVYDLEYWWSDKWDSMSFGSEYDFQKPFFKQWQELRDRFPLQSLSNSKATNSEYCNVAEESRDSYMASGSWNIERTFYSNRISSIKDSADLYVVNRSELCYDDVICTDCYRVFYSLNCKNCMDSYFLYNCHGCTNCFGCSNLRSKSYCLWNEQLTKEEYYGRLTQIDLTSFKIISEFKNKFSKLCFNSIHRFANQVKVVDSTGDNLEGTKNCKQCFDATGRIEDSKYMHWVAESAKDAYDSGPGIGKGELIYEVFDTGLGAFRNLFTSVVYSSSNIEYSFNCYGCSNLFGCIGLRSKNYCILNRQYSKEEYEDLIPKIKQHMNAMPYIDNLSRIYKYGEFFPAEISPFVYNETVAKDYFSLTQEQIIKRGYKWIDRKINEYEVSIKGEELPDKLEDSLDTIIGEVIGCIHEGKCNDRCTLAYHITKEELSMYRRLGVPLPRLCFGCRHDNRLRQRNPLKLWHRQCQCAGGKSDNGIYANTISHLHGDGHCPVEFETSYAPDRPEIVYCEKCYQQEVY